MEVNEASAAQSIAVNRELLWDPDRINVNGAAICITGLWAVSRSRRQISQNTEISLGSPRGTRRSRVIPGETAGHLRREPDCLSVVALCAGGAE
jgi:Thiolase, C-terminal domain